MMTPPEELRVQFNSSVESLHSLAWSLEESNANLTRTRDLLLPRLISGQLRVDDLDIRFPPSMADAEPAPTAR